MELRDSEVSPELLNTMNECMALFRKSNAEARSWDSINRTIMACAKLMHLMRWPTIGHSFGGSPSDVRLFTRFYNETVDFILGKKRVINVIVWEGLINDATNYVNSTQWQESVGSTGSLGAKLEQFDTPPNLNKAVSKNFDSTGLRNDLLSYANRDILHAWIHQPNGIDDMLYSLILMAKIYSV